MSCFASKIHRWGLGPIETSNSGSNHAVACTKWQVMSGIYRDLLFRSKSRCFASKNYRKGLRPIESCNSGANHDDLHTQSDRWGVGPIETYNSVPKDAVLQSKSTDEGGDSWTLVILMLSTLLYIHKKTGHVWDPSRRVILVQKSMFYMEKAQVGSWTHRDL